MNQQRSSLPLGEAGRVLDRLLLLEQLIGPDCVRQVLEETACFAGRRCRLTREVIFWVVLAMGILTELPIRQVFKYARRLRPGEATPTAPASAWPASVWGWPRYAACSSGSSACWPRPRRRAPSTRAGG